MDKDNKTMNFKSENYDIESNVEQIKCINCGSANTHLQLEKRKNTILLGCILATCGFGLMIFGIIGGIIGALIGLIAGMIWSSLSSVKYDTIVICQNCGKSFKIDTEKKQKY